MTVPRLIVSALAGFAALSASPVAHACATCFGASDSKMADGMNMGILVLLGVVGIVLGGISAAFVTLAVRASRLASGRVIPVGSGATGAMGSSATQAATHP